MYETFIAQYGVQLEEYKARQFKIQAW